MNRYLTFVFACFISTLTIANEDDSINAENITEQYRNLVESKDYCGAKELISEDRFNGNATAHYLRGSYYYKGYCGEKDLEKAFQEYKKASSLGHLDAAYNVGLMYYFGKGVDQNIDSASALFLLLLEHGHQKTKSLMGILREKELANEIAIEEALNNPKFKTIKQAIEECKSGSKSDICIGGDR